MKGASYGLTLIGILLMTNFVMYIYGIDFPLSTWLNVGIIPKETSFEVIPTGTPTGGLETENYLYNILITIGAALTMGFLVGALSSYITGMSMNYVIPASIIFMFLFFFLTPLGNIISGRPTPDGSVYCYTARSGMVMFGEDLTNKTHCVTWEVHILLAMFLGVLLIATFITFIGGREW